MVRVAFFWVLILPLLVPAGFCPCHLEATEAVSPWDVDCPEPPADHHEPNCPCESVDYGIRGFLSHDAIALDGPVALPTIIDPIDLGTSTSTESQGRDAESLFPSPPRFVLYLTLLI